MDVKFPLAAYLRYLAATSDTERSEHLKAFLRDVRTKVKDLARRNYHEGEGRSVDYVVLFLPNEQLTGFIHEHDPALIDDALCQRVVMCSPLTLFAFLGVIRQAFDNFVVEQRSDRDPQLGRRVRCPVAPLHRLRRQAEAPLRSLHGEFDNLTGTRERMLDRTVRQIEILPRPSATIQGDDADRRSRAVGDGG